MRAVWNGRLDLVLQTLKRPTNHICGHCEKLAMCFSCLERRPGFVLALLDAGVDPDAYGPEILPWRPLDIAILNTDRDIVQLLLERGAKIIDRDAKFFITAAQ